MLLETPYDTLLARMKVEEAIKLFQNKVLTSKISADILKIVLFGSFAKGKETEESDLDVLILSSDGKAVREEIAKIAFSLQMDYQIPIEPIIENVEETIYPSYFLYNVLSYGKEVYSVEKEKIKQEAQANLIRLAEEYLSGAEEAAKSNRSRLAIDAAYNAAELAIKALLLRKIDDLPGSHGGVVGRFGELFVKTKEFEEDLGRRLNLALELRNSARYKYQAVLREEEVRTVLNLAQTIIDRAKS